MAIILKILETARRVISGRAFLEIRAGEDFQATAPLVQPPGFDGRPLKSDSALHVQTDITGAGAMVGILTPDSEGVAGEGESRIFARDASGATVAEIWAKADGSVLIRAASVTINADTVTLGSSPTTASLLTADLKTWLATHTHPTAAVGPPSPPLQPIVGGETVQVTAG